MTPLDLSLQTSANTPAPWDSFIQLDKRVEGRDAYRPLSHPAPSTENDLGAEEFDNQLRARDQEQSNQRAVYEQHIVQRIHEIDVRSAEISPELQADIAHTLTDAYKTRLHSESEETLSEAVSVSANGTVGRNEGVEGTDPQRAFIAPIAEKPTTAEGVSCAQNVNRLEWKKQKEREEREKRGERRERRRRRLKLKEARGEREFEQKEWEWEGREWARFDKRRPAKEDWSERAEYEEHLAGMQIFQEQMEVRRAWRHRERTLDVSQALDVLQLEELLDEWQKGCQWCRAFGKKGRGHELEDGEEEGAEQARIGYDFFEKHWRVIPSSCCSNCKSPQAICRGFKMDLVDGRYRTRRGRNCQHRGVLGKTLVASMMCGGIATLAVLEEAIEEDGGGIDVAEEEVGGPFRQIVQWGSEKKWWGGTEGNKMSSILRRVVKSARLNPCLK